MFESLTDRFEGIFTRLRGKGRLSEDDVDEVLREIRLALLEADVNLDVTKSLQARIRERAVGADLSAALNPALQVKKIVLEELTETLGGETLRIRYASKPPTVVLMAGLQGSGKTTNSAKLARWFRSQGRNPMLVGADLQRPAAVQQLRTLAAQIDVPVHSADDEVVASGTGDPVEVASGAVAEARRRGRDVVIVDTAGRLAVDEAMMAEVAAIRDAVQPREILFVADAMTGQDAVNTAKAFHDRLDFTGVVLTKLDGDARGGAALTIRHTVDEPIKFVSNGEKMDALDVFHPDRMAQRILGMGDITSLVEKAQQQYDEEQARRLEKKIRKNQFDFQDFLDQLQQIRKMGSLKDLMGMIPGVGKALKGVDISDDAFKGVEAIIHSMTPAERSDPDLIDMSRKKRIALGSGKDLSEVNQFMKQFDQMRQMMRTMQKMPAGMRMGPGRR